MSRLHFSSEVKDIIALVETTKQNMFITGKAGTGKSTLLNYISKEIDPTIIVLAPTGIAALNVSGETIHSFFKLKPGYELDEATHGRIHKNMIAKYANIHTVIIDEISMLRADILDAIHIFLQRVRNNSEYFGGVRMIFFGDLFQLPPVLKNEEENSFLTRYSSPYFFSSTIFEKVDLFSDPFQLKICELDQVYRQTDEVFISILNGIRTKEIEPSQLALLNKQVGANNQTNNIFPIQLVSTNAQANRLNQQKLNLTSGQEITYEASENGEVKNLRPNESIINVKVGAQIMFINNDPDKRWVNGSLGEITSYEKELDEETQTSYMVLVVQLEHGKKVKVTPFTWSISRYTFKNQRFIREEIGSFTQIPLKLAWAITIHKSQGKTFNNVNIDLGDKSFAHGQTYVALSRCRQLENIVLERPVKESDILVDQRIVEYYKQS